MYRYEKFLRDLKVYERITFLSVPLLPECNCLMCLHVSLGPTEKDINIRLTKAWTAINRLSVIWKSDLTDKIKHSFFQTVVVLILLYGWITWTLTKCMKKKLDANYTRMLQAIFKQPGGNNPQKSISLATYHPLRKLSKSDDPDMWETAGEVRTNS